MSRVAHRRVGAGRLALLALAAIACADRGGQEGPVSLRGHYASGFEASEFRRCGEDAAWWISDPTGELYEQYDALMLGEYEAAYVELEAKVSGQGEYGHLGSYEREVTVESVLEVRVAAADDCD